MEISDIGLYYSITILYSFVSILLLYCITILYSITTVNSFVYNKLLILVFQVSQPFRGNPLNASILSRKIVDGVVSKFGRSFLLFREVDTNFLPKLI